MSTKIKVTIADQDGVVLDAHEVDIVALAQAVVDVHASRGEVAAAKLLARAGEDIDASVSHEIRAAWARYVKAKRHTGKHEQKSRGAAKTRG